jgi:O-antigen ligase
VALHLDGNLHFMLRAGSANIHNDALQYLAESGIVGFGLMLGVLVSLSWRIRYRRLAAWMPGVLLYAGIGAIALQSTFDLPMRSPAVFYCWLAILAGASKILMEKSKEERTSRKSGMPKENLCASERSRET